MLVFKTIDTERDFIDGKVIFTDYVKHRFLKNSIYRSVFDS